MIDGVRGLSAYSLFYNASGEPTPTCAVGVIDLSQGLTVVEEENDTFIFDVNGETIELDLEAGFIPRRNCWNT